MAYAKLLGEYDVKDIYSSQPEAQFNQDPEWSSKKRTAGAS